MNDQRPNRLGEILPSIIQQYGLIAVQHHAKRAERLHGLARANAFRQAQNILTILQTHIHERPPKSPESEAA